MSSSTTTTTTATCDIKSLKQKYREQLAQPIFSNAWFSPQQQQQQGIIVQSTMKDVTQLKSRKFLSTYTTTTTTNQCQSIGFPAELSNTQLILPSPSGKYWAVFKRESPSSSSSSSSAATANKKVDRIDVFAADSQCLLHSISLQKHHGRIYTGVPFGAPQWNRAETCIVYSAEPIPPKAKGFFADGDDEEEENKGQEGEEKEQANTKLEEEQGVGREFEFEEHWGEQLSDSKCPSLYVWDLELQRVKYLKHEGWSCGQPVWTADGTAIVYVAWPHTNKRLGLIYYNTRPSALFRVVYDGKRANLNAPGVPRRIPVESTGACPQYPSISPNGLGLAFLTAVMPEDQQQRGLDSFALPHKMGEELRVIFCTAPHGASFLASDAVRGKSQHPKGKSHFYFFAVNPGQQLWASNDQVWAAVDQGVTRSVVRFSTSRVAATGALHALPSLFDTVVSAANDAEQVVWGKQQQHGATQILSILPNNNNNNHNNNNSNVTIHALVSVSNALSPPEVFLWSVSPVKRAEETETKQTSEEQLRVTRVTSALPVLNGLEGANIEEIYVSFNSNSSATTEVEVAQGEADHCSLLLSPASSPGVGEAAEEGMEQKQTFPLIVYPHGGPHSHFLNAYSYNLAFYVRCGFRILLVNYRGSTAQGSREDLWSLAGEVGNQDVKDVVRVMNQVMNRQQQQQQQQPMYVMGGSHGGFLTLHLIGQYPSLFQAAVCRNPVADLTLMVGTTDIPDWCVFEVTGGNNSNAIYSELEKYHKMSPVSYVGDVKTPLLMCLGDCDRRVPMSQAIHYFRSLPDRTQKKHKLLIYPGAQHALNDSVAIEVDHAINGVLWLLKHQL